MILSDTNDSIEAYTDATATTTEPTYYVRYADMSSSSFAITGAGKSAGSLAGTTHTAILAAPGASTHRYVKEVHICNVDTVSHNITVHLDDNTTEIPMASAVTLAAGETLYWSDETGWKVQPQTFALTDSQVTTAKLADAAVSLAKMADLAQKQVIGRADAAGTGVPTALSGSQVRAILDMETTDIVTFAAQVISATFPYLKLDQTGASADEKKWRMYATGGAFIFDLLNDAENAAGTIMDVARTADNVDRVGFYTSGSVKLNITDAGIEATGVIRNAPTVVASLPAAGTVGAGARHSVTDATATTFMSTVAGGGANFVPVISDGTNWLIG